jgi:hypothetical protein
MRRVQGIARKLAQVLPLDTFSFQRTQRFDRL